jgi:NAD(P)-dependent dehydrogenase (short-subunit alcohol dehydrogenase family)
MAASWAGTGGLQRVAPRRRTPVACRAAAAHASVRRMREPAPRPTLQVPGGAQVVAFLCSDKAAFVNGIALPIDGGFHLGKV